MAVKKSAKQKKREQSGERVSATLRHIRISPRKLRLVIDLIRGKQIDTALQLLRFNKRRGGAILRKLVLSAVSNAREHKGLDVDSLWVRGGWVDTGPTLKRFMPRAQGRASEIRKRSSHVTVVVGE